MTATARLSIVLLFGACTTPKSPAPPQARAALQAVSGPSTPASTVSPPVSAEPVARHPDFGAGERASPTVQGDMVSVNNTYCGVSRGKLAPDVIGQFVSRVEYRGSDPRFQGKTFEFNQCCNMCIERFPQMWAQNPDAILAWHGVELSQR